MAFPDRQIRGGSHPDPADPEIRGGGLEISFFGPTGLSLVLKYRGPQGARPPLDPPLNTDICNWMLTGFCAFEVTTTGEEELGDANHSRNRL